MGWLVLTFALGWACNWARFDFGLWPAALTGTVVFAWLRHREAAQVAMSIATAASLIGAALAYQAHRVFAKCDQAPGSSERKLSHEIDQENFPTFQNHHNRTHSYVSD